MFKFRAGFAERKAVVLQFMRLASLPSRLQSKWAFTGDGNVGLDKKRYSIAHVKNKHYIGI
jgi:hypothetical protein